MHRKIIVLSIFLFLLFGSVHAEYSRWLTGQLSLGTSAIIYGDEDFRTFNKSLLASDYKRFVFTVDVSGGIVLDDHVRLQLGSILNYDSFITKSFNSIYLDYNFYTGIRVYPALSGFNFGIDYVVGRRSNIFKLPEVEVEEAEALTPSAQDFGVHTSWGNGFRFSAEYDFKYDTTGFAPIIGVSWRCMPRGTTHDNVLSVFFKILFR